MGGSALVAPSAVEPRTPLWRGWWNQLLDLLLPPRCVGCRREGAFFCADCMKQIPRLEATVCVRCGDRAAVGDLCPRCRTSPLRIDRVRSVFYFEGPLRQAVHQLKYNGRAALAAPLGAALAAYWRQNPAQVDVVTPVPLHAARLRARGYNQAALLAREMARRVGLPLDERLLVRQRFTLSQVELNAEQRKENVRDAFHCPDGRARGRRVLLIDDVCTTGSTLDACAVALYEGGAQSVQALTLARAR